MERMLRLSDGQTIDDQQEIDRLLEQRRSLFDQRKATPPPEVLKDFDLTQAILSRRERVLFGELEFDYGGLDPYKNPQFEIVDLTIDLTPEAENLPRSVIGFELSIGSKKITIDVLYNDEVKEYWKHYGNDRKLEKVASANLLSALQENHWQPSFLDAWSVAK